MVEGGNTTIYLVFVNEQKVVEERALPFAENDVRLCVDVFSTHEVLHVLSGVQDAWANV
jgi:hypothetical protein